jgi:Methyltransferase domain
MIDREQLRIGPIMGHYVQYGCGFSAGQGWLNFDASPTLRIERIPLVGNVISAAISGNRNRFPTSVRYGDIRRGPLVPAGTADGVYASHVLEHLSHSDFRKALAHTNIMLVDGGVFRLIVPDLLERARRYVSTAAEKSQAAEEFLHATLLGKEHRPAGLLGMLREFIGNSSHLWMWDETSIAEELKRAGFNQIRRCDQGDSGLPIFDAVEDPSRFYDTNLNIRECAMEARKSRSTPPEVREEVIARSEAGEAVSRSEVKAAIADAEPRLVREVHIAGCEMGIPLLKRGPAPTAEELLESNARRLLSPHYAAL